MSGRGPIERDGSTPAARDGKRSARVLEFPDARVVPVERENGRAGSGMAVGSMSAPRSRSHHVIDLELRRRWLAQRSERRQATIADDPDDDPPAA